MLDPLTALGLASNITQLLSFSRELISKGREIHAAADGALVEHLELEAIAKSLQELTSKLTLPNEQLETPRKTDCELRHLCDSCRDAADKLLSAIKSLKAQGKHEKWNSFRQALSCIWRQDEIDSLAARLELYRRQIDTVLLVSLREHIEQADRDNTKRADRMSKALLGVIDATKQYHADLIDTLHERNWRSDNERDMAMFSAKLSSTAENQREQLVSSKLLNLLFFSELEDRHETISEAQKKTFEWIYEEQKEGRNCSTDLQVELQGEKPTVKNNGEEEARVQQDHAKEDQPIWDSFTTWLRSGETLYWITGKPGSGKSTLMKFLYSDRRTFQHLHSWAQKYTLLTAGFYFWNSGTQMQMSRDGLLRSLLYQALKDRPALIPPLFPRRWKNYQLFGGDLHPWTWSELTRALKLLTSNSSLRFFFLVDGLDEYGGKSSDLVDFLIGLSLSHNVKICTSSRPWLVFEEAFNHRRWLRLEDLTRRDIKLFVSENLHGNTRFTALSEIKPQEALNLVGEITDKACGVFLWVHLVVKSLLEGLRDGDSISDLKKRLLLLPSDLEKLFRKILDNIDADYFREASEIFQLVRADPGLSLITLSLAQEGLEAALEADVRQFTLEESRYRADTMRRRLNSRCKGLLEARSNSLTNDGKVQYLHRTVRDFLWTPDIWDYVLSGTRNTNPSFDLNVAFCGLCLHRIKTCKPSSSSEMKSRFWDMVTLCISYAEKGEESSGTSQIRVLDELDKAGCQLWDSAFGYYQGEPHWTNIPFTDKKLPHTVRSFFEFAFHTRLYSYVDAKLAGGLDIDYLMNERSLLLSAALNEDSRMVDLLFQYGADPNRLEESSGKTTWQLVFQKCSTTAVRTQKSDDILEQFAKHGADPKVKFMTLQQTDSSTGHHAIGGSIDNSLPEAYTDRRVTSRAKLAITVRNFFSKRESKSTGRLAGNTELNRGKNVIGN